jgi:hypothetical protein
MNTITGPLPAPARERRSKPAAPQDSRQTKSEETMIVPDSVYGAVILSIIDFTLSVVMITGIGFVLALFPLLNRLGKLDDEKIKKGSH